MKLGLERAVLSHNREQQGDESDDNNLNKKKTDREAHAKEIDELLKKGQYLVLLPWKLLALAQFCALTPMF
jgi:hypothetical protein